MHALKNTLSLAWGISGVVAIMLMLFYQVIPENFKSVIRLFMPFLSLLIFSYVGLGIVIGLLHLFFPEPNEKSIAGGTEARARRDNEESIYGATSPYTYTPVDNFRGGPDDRGEFENDDNDAFPGSTDGGFGTGFGLDNDGGDADGVGDGD